MARELRAWVGEWHMNCINQRLAFSEAVDKDGILLKAMIETGSKLSIFSNTILLIEGHDRNGLETRAGGTKADPISYEPAETSTSKDGT